MKEAPCQRYSYAVHCGRMHYVVLPADWTAINVITSVTVKSICVVVTISGTLNNSFHSGWNCASSRTRGSEFKINLIC